MDHCSESHDHADAISLVIAHTDMFSKTEKMANFFKAFSDNTRISILIALSISELCVCDISKIVGISQSAISHQLRLLKHMYLVKNRKEGKTVYYSLCDMHIKSIIEQGFSHVSE